MSQDADAEITRLDAMIVGLFNAGVGGRRPSSVGAAGVKYWQAVPTDETRR